MPRKWLVLPLVIVWILCPGVSLWAAQPSPRKSDKKAPPRTYRTWTDATGKFRVRAALVDVEDDKVRLLKADGNEVSVPLEKLSEADRRFVEKQKVAAPAEPEEAAATAEGDWPGWLGPNRDGKSPDKGLLKQWPPGGPRLLWKATGIGKGYSGAAVSNGTVYVTGEAGNSLNIFAYDLEGNPKWKVNHGPAWTGDHPGSRATPTIDGDNLYLLSGAGSLGCFDARSGKRRWARDAKEFGGAPGAWGYAESPLVQGNMVVFKPGGKNCIVALDKLSGRPIWSSQGFAAGPEYGSCLAISFQGPPIIVAGTRAGIVALSAQSGAVLWANKFAAGNTANCPTPAFSDGYVFWANGYGKGGICLKLGPRGTAAEAWTTRDMDCHHGGYVIHNGYIYGNHSGGWVCLDLRTGQKKWSDRGVGKGSLCWADDMLYLFGENGGNAALATCSPDGLQIKGRLKVDGEGPSWAHPVVIGGRLYLRYDSTLYCFDVKTPQ